MSWVVEQSENTSSVTVNGNTITCTKDGYFDSPINVMYKDPADRNGQYFWQLQFQELDPQGGGSAVGLTTEQGFQGGYGLKAMKYLGNLSDGSSLLVQSFGENIKQGDQFGILLQLTNADMKMYLFHNERPLGLAFHTQSPYSKPLYPVVSFNSNGKVTITRSPQTPTSLDRASSQFAGVEGAWEIVDYQQHPECVGYQFHIKRQDQGQNVYNLHTRVVNNLNCCLEHNSATNEWKAAGVMSTRMAGPPDEMKKERVISSLISGIQNIQVQGQQQLTIQLNNGEQVTLNRFTEAAPSPVTQNIFN